LAAQQFLKKESRQWGQQESAKEVKLRDMHVYESVTRTLTHTSVASPCAYTRERKKESTLLASLYSCARKKASYSLFAASSIHRKKKKKKTKNTVMPTIPNNMTDALCRVLEREREREREWGCLVRVGWMMMLSRQRCRRQLPHHAPLLFFYYLLAWTPFVYLFNHQQIVKQNKTLL
jgi:hypothetical protein